MGGCLQAGANLNNLFAAHGDGHAGAAIGQRCVLD
jgi:hypothetical protein